MRALASPSAILLSTALRVRPRAFQSRFILPELQTILRLSSNSSSSPIAESQCRETFRLGALERRYFDQWNTEHDNQLERREIKDGQSRQHAGKEDAGSGHKHKPADSMSEGKLLTTPSRLFKLIIPLATIGHNPNHKDIEPIAILIHPQQPLSYLERLIRSEVPPLQDENGQKCPLSVSFIALQREDDAIRPKKKMYQGAASEDHRSEAGGDAEAESKADLYRRLRSNEVDETYSYLQRTEHDEKHKHKEQRFVRWSQSTEIGDFIRDAAQAQEFIVSIQGAPAGLRQIHVTVPSFWERTYFLRMRLRKVSRRIQDIMEIKHECDYLAHRGAQRVALGGFGILASWWYLVYRLTFETELGWDTMEPVTYLVSLSTLMGGYLWFLYHNREMSYRSALDFTINARQKKLYQMKGVDLHAWESLIEEANALRKEIKTIAAEYDAEWDERKDEQDDRVTEALKQERKYKNGSKHEEEEDHDD